MSVLSRLRRIVLAVRDFIAPELKVLAALEAEGASVVVPGERVAPKGEFCCCSRPDVRQASTVSCCSGLGSLLDVDTSAPSGE